MTAQRALQERSKWPPRELHVVPDGPRAIKDTEDGLQTAQDAPKRPQKASKMRPKRASRRTNWPVPFVKRVCFTNSPFGFSDAPRRPKRPPRPPQN
eukprot:5264103-Pyramimonas_sp.AAC.1